MERALVIFESMFGNTRTIAEAVAEGLSSRFVTDLTEVSTAPPRIAEDVSLVVLGGPTHAFGLTRARTRQDAATAADEPLVSPAGGLRERRCRGLRHPHRQAAGTGFRCASRREASPPARVPFRCRCGELLRDGNQGAARAWRG